MCDERKQNFTGFIWLFGFCFDDDFVVFFGWSLPDLWRKEWNETKILFAKIYFISS
jgi:hypothetical protein